MQLAPAAFQPTELLQRDWRRNAWPAFKTGGTMGLISLLILKGKSVLLSCNPLILFILHAPLRGTALFIRY
jgi:hypothetical protein